MAAAVHSQTSTAGHSAGLFVGAMQYLPKHTIPGGTVYVFALPENQTGRDGSSRMRSDARTAATSVRGSFSCAETATAPREPRP